MDLGRQVLQKALLQFQRWRSLRPDLHLSVNVSKRQLFLPSFVDQLLDDLRQLGLSPADLTLEVTESVALLDVEFAEERLAHLAGLGFTLSIDDFGTGYASLSQLHELPIKELKIDMSFVRRVHTPDGGRMVQAIINLAQALHIVTVAEGIEDEHTAQALQDLGVDVLQGYYYGKPGPAETIDSFLEGEAGRAS
jgi:EAL domain-containing protein (putative c-di-GMP-specific phosphodiesterase class I)